MHGVAIVAQRAGVGAENRQRSGGNGWVNCCETGGIERDEAKAARRDRGASGKGVVDAAGQFPSAEIDGTRSGVLQFHELMHVIGNIRRLERVAENRDAIGVEVRFLDGMILQLVNDNLRSGDCSQEQNGEQKEREERSAHRCRCKESGSEFHFGAAFPFPP